MILVQFALSPPFSGLSTEERSKDKCVLAEDKLLLNYFSVFDGLFSRSKHNPTHKTTTNQNSRLCKKITHLPWFPADGWHHTQPSTKQLVPSAGARNLKAEGLVELTFILGRKEQSQLGVSTSW